jgi:Cdc6-like AAA superfamily ATPase
VPTAPTPFIGREYEVQAVRARLLEPETRLLTLTGAGGTGKTRLALEVAAALLNAFVDGAFFVNLVPITDPILVLPTIAQTLGVVEVGGQPLRETIWVCRPPIRAIMSAQPRISNRSWRSRHELILPLRAGDRCHSLQAIGGIRHCSLVGHAGAQRQALLAEHDGLCVVSLFLCHYGQAGQLPGG